MLTPAELYERARDDASSGRLARARTWCVRALERDPEPELATRITVTLAYLDAERGDLTGGIAGCEEVLADPDHAGAERGRTLAQLGLLRMRSGDAERAIVAFRDAIALLSGCDEDVARIHLNRGNVHLQRYEPGAAEDDFDDARRFARRADKPVMAAKALHNRGYARMLRGELVGALHDLDEARRTLAPLSPVSLAVCDQDRAEVLLAAGLADEAREVLRHVAAVFGRRRMRQQQAECELLLARLHLFADEFAVALRTARTATRRFDSHGSHTWAMRAQVYGLVAELALSRSNEAIVARAIELAEALTAEGFTASGVRARLVAALAACRTGDPDTASALLARVRVTESTPLDIHLFAAQARAELGAARGRPGRAHAHLATALTRVDRWQAGFGPLDVQAGTAAYGRSCALLGLRLAAERGDVPIVLEWTERARSLAGRVTAVRPPRDPEAAALLSRIRALYGSGVTAETGALERAIRERLWATQTHLPANPVTLDELRSELVDSDSTYIAYFHTGTRLYALAIAPDTDAMVDLGSIDEIASLLHGLPADLAMIATRTSESMHRVLVSSIRMRLQAIADRLWRPLAGLTSGERVVLSATGALADVTWSLLPGLAGRPLTVARSATGWAQSRSNRKPGCAGFVAGPRVERAEAEVRHGAGFWAEHDLLDAGDATAHAVSKLAARVDVLHIAAHGRHSAQSPMFSAFELVDGPWFGYDIDHVERVPTIVILSACELGRSTKRWGLETIGMTTAWLHAGTRCVVASPAPLSDDVAYEVLGSMHRRIARGEPVADALADAVAHSDEPVPLMCYGA